MGQNFENWAKFSKRGKKKLEVRVICALNARQVRMNLVAESARHLQMTRTQILRVDTRDLPEAVIIHISCVLHCKIDHPHTLHVNGHIAISLPASYGASISQTTH